MYAAQAPQRVRFSISKRVALVVIAALDLGFLRLQSPRMGLPDTKDF
jgi:hypothetical protein